MNSSQIRSPEVAGSFYPAKHQELDSVLDGLLAAIPIEEHEGTLRGIIVPHAGYQYSGVTAAFAYKLLTGLTFDTIVIISPSHKEYFNGVSVYSGKAYETPFGVLSVDAELRSELTAKEVNISISEHGHGAEHAIEVQLPFIQKILGKVKILPIVMGDQRREYCFRLGEKLGEILKGKSALLVASSDLSHYHPAHDANMHDAIVIKNVAAFSPERLMESLERDQAEACGGGPIVAMMIAARSLGGNTVKILDHRNSGDITGDKSSVVGYLSAAILKQR
ncbi:MAG: AmmeMemoRadiSam system protein B [Bacteroidota bacterium]